MRAIAVVIPCFNLGRFVEEAVDSVVAQTRPAAEIVVVDDGSPDPLTRRRLATLSRPGLRVSRIENRGAAGARNHGVSLTSAPYLLFLDADDALEPTYLEKTGALLDGEPDLDFVSTGMLGFGDADYVFTPPPPELVPAFTRGTIPVTALMRRSTWDVVGGFDESLRTSMDLDFWITAFEYGFRGRVVDEPLLLRRVRSDSLHHGAVERGSHRGVMETILRKHRETVDRIGPALLIAKETFIVEQRADREHLERTVSDLSAELARLEGRIADIRRDLRERGTPVVDLGDFRRLEPIGTGPGLESRTPIEHVHVERFLAAHAADRRGRVLEVDGPRQSARERPTGETGSGALGDGASAADSSPDPSGPFDCIVLARTPPDADGLRAALLHARQALEPGGVLLAAVPATNRLEDAGGCLFTEASLRRLLGEVFPPEGVEVLAAGNLKARLAILYGLAAEDLDRPDSDRDDPRFPVVYCVRAVNSPPPATEVEPWTRLSVEDRTASAAILMYHRVGEPGVDPHGLCIGVEAFREQMRFLARRYRVLSLEELARRVIAGSLPDGAVAVTFDDGTIDALDVAAPILNDLGLPATFFVNTDRLEEAHEPWWEVLARIFLGDAPVPLELEVVLDADPLRLATDSGSGRAAAYRMIHEWLLYATRSGRERVMARVAEWSGTDLSPRCEHRLLLPAEVRELAGRPGLAVGSHSIHHLWLPGQPREVQDREIRESRRDLERVSGRPVTLFSYPYGGHDAETVELVRAAGYVAAVTIEPRVLSESANALALPRLDVRAGRVAEFARLLERAFLDGEVAAP